MFPLPDSLVHSFPRFQSYSAVIGILYLGMNEDLKITCLKLNLVFLPCLESAVIDFFNLTEYPQGTSIL